MAKTGSNAPVGISVFAGVATTCGLLKAAVGKMYLVLVDAYSKWPEIDEMNITTVEETVGQILTLLVRMGIPQQLLSDNGQ